jgi:hypothetical protein
MEVPASTRVGNLHYMLSLALWISRHKASIFEIELDLLIWLPQLERLGLAPAVRFNATPLAQDLEGSGSGSSAGAGRRL